MAFPWNRAPRRKRIGALRAARIAKHYGVPGPIARTVAFAALVTGTRQALAFALVEQESGFRHIFGHDAGGPFPGQAVTRERYRELVRHVERGGTSNGVGLTQITYGGYLTANPGLWRPLANVKFGLGLIGSLIRRYGKRKGLAIYNGGPANPQFSYADSVLALERKWRDRFS